MIRFRRIRRFYGKLNLLFILNSYLNLFRLTVLDGFVEVGENFYVFNYSFNS